MACCSFVCSRRTASSSSLTEWMFSVSSPPVAGKLWLPFRSAVHLGSCGRRFPSAFRSMSSIFSVCAIMLVSSYEFVADSMHRQKKTWLLRNWFEFLANPHNVSVHRARGRKILITPDLVEQPVAAHRLPGMTQKMLQQLKLLTRKLHRLTTTQDLVAAQVHVDIAEGIAVLLFRERLCPPQNGLHACEQFSDREGFGDVVIGSEFETHNLVHFLAARGKHDDGNRRALRLQLLTHIEPAHARHHHVEDDQVRGILQSPLEPFHAVECRYHLEALVLEIIAEPRDHVRLIFDDQNLRSHDLSLGLSPEYGTTPNSVASHAAASAVRKAGSNGNAIVNLLPFSGVLATITYQPCARAMWRTSERPNPDPLMLCTSGSPQR